MKALRKPTSLTSVEIAVYNLISYENRSWNAESQDRLVRDRIKKEMAQRKAKGLKDLLRKLKSEQRTAAKIAAKKEAAAAAQSDALTQISFHMRYKMPDLASWPTKAQAKDAAPFEKFGKQTKFARAIFMKSFMNAKLEKLWPYKKGANSNYFDVRQTSRIDLYKEVDNEWNVYKSQRFPVQNYTFILHLPKNHSFVVDGGLLTIFNGKKVNRKGMAVTWFEQGRGLDLNKIEGYLIRGYHIAKSERVRSLSDAVYYVEKLRSKTAAEIVERRANKALAAKGLENVWITEADSIAAGNCPAGTKRFKQDYETKNHYGKIGAVRVDELLAKANGSAYFVKRIIAHKFGLTV